LTKFRARRAFTLVEVLVVLGILICLIGLLLPMISHMREDAKRVQCVSKVRQLTVAWQTYATDYERHTCSPNDWINGPLKGKLGLERGLLWPYVKDYSMFRCVDDPITSDDSPNCSSFQMNGALPRKLDDLTTASGTFVFIEGAPMLVSLKLTPTFGGRLGVNHKAASDADVGTPVSFADGHAIFWRYADFRSGVGWGGAFAPNSPDSLQLQAWSGVAP
jgi:competence protein ComGC